MRCLESPSLRPPLTTYVSELMLMWGLEVVAELVLGPETTRSLSPGPWTCLGQESPPRAVSEEVGGGSTEQVCPTRERRGEEGSVSDM